MFKRFIAGLTAIVLSLGMVALTASPASAHAGNITASAVCNPTTKQYDVTYTLSWSNIPDGVSAPISTRTGSTSFQNGWSYGTWPANQWTSRGTTSGASGSVSWTESLPGTTVGNGPWVYAYTPWSNNHQGATKHDTRIEGLTGDCGEEKIVICHATGAAGWQALPPLPISGVYNGHLDHQNNKDIIPPFQYNGQTYSMNWPAGQAIYDNNCSKKVTPDVPDWKKAECSATPGVPGTTGHYRIPSAKSDKVTYLVAITDSATVPGSGSSSWQPATELGTWIEVAVDKYVHIKAVAVSPFELTGTTTWKFKITAKSANECKVDADKPKPPTFTNPVCVAVGSSEGTAKIPTGVTGVIYEWRTYKGSGSKGSDYNWTAWTAVGQGEELSFPHGTLIQIRAKIADGYKFDGSWGSGWTGSSGGGKYVEYEFKNGTHPSKCVVPKTPDVKQAECKPGHPGQIKDGQYRIPTTSGVHYKVNGTTIPENSWRTVTGPFPKTITITAYPDNGYAFPPGTQTEFVLEFTSPGDCKTVIPQPKTPDWNDFACTEEAGEVTGGTFQVTPVTGVTYSYGPSATGPWTPMTPGQSYDAAPGETVYFLAELVNDAITKWADGVQTTWSHTFDGKDCRGVVQQPTVPGHVDFTCVEDSEEGPDTQRARLLAAATVNGGTYSIEPVEHVVYEKWIGPGEDDWQVIDPLDSPFQAEPGETVKIRWKLADPENYTWDESVTVFEWSHTFTPDPCTATPVAPQPPLPETCTVDENGVSQYAKGSVTIPVAEGVKYYLEGESVVQGETYDLEPGTYTLTAEPDDGYEFEEGATTSFEVVISKADPCGDFETLPTVVPLAVQTNLACTGLGSYELSVEPAVLAHGVTWTVTGGLPNTVGEWPVEGETVVTITAVPSSEEFGFGDGEEDNYREWTFVYTLPEDCLETFPLTGGGVAWSGFGLAALLVIGGALLMANRRREEQLIIE